MKFNKLIIPLLISLIFLSFFKKEEPKFLVIKNKIDFFNVDALGNIYITKDTELLKYLKNGNFFARYSNLKLGNITHVDVTNPLKIVVYYRDFQEVIFLDNQLSLNSTPVLLEEIGYEQTELVCAGANNSFWIYNKQNNELLRFNENSKKINATGNLKQVLKSNLNPNFMIEQNSNLFLNCPENGIYVFDMFGAFSKLIPIKNLKEFQTNETNIYYQKDSVFCSYNFKLFEDVCKLIQNSKTIGINKYYNHKIYSQFLDSLVVQDF